ncbi:hypothetical protein ITJ86_09450 [Winogradskyella sp. F6397]|uniref:DUF4890 domain-containing protein n=1 Tax=Winogradskyella marina TaxID=2785530 RepID=A0ABS0EJ07_9FLAO|nr:hypothetical protein [Winogradskyella marina]MBF8150121.1 hypothetical protein [Winogradskyella marina]
MKKIITLCLFVFALFLGTQNAVAQNSKLETAQKVNTEAAEKTEALRQFVKFDNTQRDQIYEAQQEFIRSSYAIKSQKETADYKKEKTKAISAHLETRMKTILSAEQFERYKQFSRS